MRIKKAAKVAFHGFILERFAQFPKRYHKRLLKTAIMTLRYTPPRQLESAKPVTPTPIAQKPRITKFSAYKFYQIFSNRMHSHRYEFFKRIVAANRKRIYAEAYMRKLGRMVEKIRTFNMYKVIGRWIEFVEQRRKAGY
jgi:hypothetical protein